MGSERRKDAINKAENAFWEQIALSYPEIKTGDLSPDVSIPFQWAMDKVVEEWIEVNGNESKHIKEKAYITEFLDDYKKFTLDVFADGQSAEYKNIFVFLKATFENYLLMERENNANKNS